jgi:hypothetical protein
VSKRTNTPIGEVVCPHKGCNQVCKVYRFQPRTEGRQTVFTGKHYAECSVHGRIGSDGNPAVTNYILTEGKIWGANDRKPAAPEKPAQKSAPAQTPAQKTPAPQPRNSPAPAPKPNPKSNWWDTVI